jgi:hypothetical protein
MLDCHRFRGRYTADNIWHEYEDTSAAFDISNSISHVVTDSASNMLKVFSFPGFEASAHGDDDDDVPELIDQTDNQITSRQIRHLTTFLITCPASHTPLTCIKDGLKTADHLTKILRKTSTIVSAVRKQGKSTHASDLLKWKPPADCQRHPMELTA